MRKGSVIAILGSLLILLAAMPAAAADLGETNRGQSVITVVGHAETTVPPDVAVVTAGVVTSGTTVEFARRENDLVMHRLITALLNQGIDRTQITTSQFNLQPIYSSDPKESGLGKIIGYHLQNNVTVLVEDLTKIGTVVDAAFQAGANQFQGIRFNLKDDSAVRDRLLKDAVRDGVHKANILADSLGVKLGKPVSVSESGTMAIRSDAYGNVTFAAKGTVIESGTLTIAADVNMVFGILP